MREPMMTEKQAYGQLAASRAKLRAGARLHKHLRPVFARRGGGHGQNKYRDARTKTIAICDALHPILLGERRRNRVRGK